ncbi:hypothetical protein C7I55_16120 [Sphingomonas deserti]|uniref:Uncharacterized protein n=1 Tax=Allosphingosinicella deserti TaxID=2116704 RepID=A0A2P7QLK0_9SPHN|nr:hypothetical protein C7I55_16120 [Sphingomonas deserti]
MFRIWVYVAVASLIAGLAFALGQIAPGLGTSFAILASTLWVSYSVYRQSQHQRRCSEAS